MGVVRLDREIGDGELDLVGPDSARFGLRREAVALAEIEEDVGALPITRLPSTQEGGAKDGVSIPASSQTFISAPVPSPAPRRHSRRRLPPMRGG